MSSEKCLAYLYTKCLTVYLGLGSRIEEKPLWWHTSSKFVFSLQCIPAVSSVAFSFICMS